MKNERRISGVSVIAVSLVHLVLISLLWRIHQPSIELDTAQLNFIDLEGHFSKASAVQQEAPEPPKPALKPEPEVKPKPKEKPKLKGVTMPAKADIVTPKEETEPKEEAPKPAPQQEVKPTTQGGLAAEGDGLGVGKSLVDSGQQGGTIKEPTHLGNHLGNRVIYPAISREEGEEGVVGLEVAVTAEGAAAAVKVISSSGYPRLDRAARSAAQKFRFTPAKRAGIPIATSYRFNIRFSLEDGNTHF